MNWKEDGWKLVVLAVVVIGLIWWRQRGADTDNERELAEQLELEQQVDKFLEERGISLPEGSERANLRDVSGGTATGVAVRRMVDGEVQYTLVAALEEMEQGWYEAWLVREDEAVSMGRMRSGKGGYVVDYEAETLVEGEGVKVSRETATSPQPTEVVLEGSF